MPRMLVDGGAEYDDGTPSNSSQQAKDVTTFLTWAGYPFQVRAFECFLWEGQLSVVPRCQEINVPRCHWHLVCFGIKPGKDAEASD